MLSGPTVAMSTKTMLTGTFLAEQTHSNPPSYTLVSVSAIDTVGDGPRARPVAASAGGAGSAGRRARAEKFGAKLTKLPALDDFDPLLDKSEDSAFVVPACRGQKSAANAPTGVNSPGVCTTTANGPASTPSVSSSPEKRPLTSSEKGKDSNGANTGISSGVASTAARTGNSSAKDSATGRAGSALHSPSKTSGPNRPASSASRGRAGQGGSLRKRPRSQRSYKRPASEASSRDPIEISDRLYNFVQKPWMFDKTNTELLTYLAQRTRDPEIANVRSECESPSHTVVFGSSMQSISTGSNSPSARSPRKHTHHKELFDECLHKDNQRAVLEGLESVTSPDRKSPQKLLYSPQRLAKAQLARERGCRLDEQLRDIKILPASFFETEESLAAGSSWQDKAAFDQAVQCAEAQLLKAYKDYKAWRSKHGYPAPDVSLKADELAKDKRSSRISKMQAA